MGGKYEMKNLRTNFGFIISRLHRLSWIPRKVKLYLCGNINPVHLNLNLVDINRVGKFHVLDNDMGLSRELKAFGFREPLNSKFYYNFISEDDIVLDIGANLGYFSVLSSKAKKIIAIEPIKQCISVIRKNSVEFGIDGKIIIINAAAGGGKNILIERLDNINHSRVVDEENGNTVKMRPRSLKYFVDKFSGNVVRMDLEGYEYDLLYKKDLSKIDKICLEYHTWIIGNKKTKKFLNFMEEEGFVIRHLIEELPLRLYPFYRILKISGLIRLVTRVRKDILPSAAYPYFLSGKSAKHINFERIKK